jgi:hypothetical protein
VLLEGLAALSARRRDRHDNDNDTTAAAAAAGSHTDSSSRSSRSSLSSSEAREEIQLFPHHPTLKANLLKNKKKFAQHYNFSTYNGSKILL